MFKYEEICNIEQDFYNLFEPKNGIETEKSYKIKKELAKYVAHQIFSHDVAFNDCKLTFKEWCIKFKYVYEK